MPYGAHNFHASVAPTIFMPNKMFWSRQYLSICPKKKFVDAHFNAHNHAHLNAHESPKPVAPTTFMHPQFLFKNFNWIAR